jgi:hypothetical protein
MTKNDILDNFEEYDPRAIQESFEYRILLTLFWVVWSVKSFYDGTVVLEFVIAGPSGIFTFFPYNMGIVYNNYFIGVLTLGMGIIVFKQSEHRIFYLFSFVGIYLTMLHTEKIAEGVGLVFIPMIMVLFVKNLRTCLICYALSLVSYVLFSRNVFDRIESLLTSPYLLVIYSLIFMTAFSYRARLFPLNKVIVKLRYRLFALLGFLPFILEHFFSEIN